MLMSCKDDGAAISVCGDCYFYELNEDVDAGRGFCRSHLNYVFDGLDACSDYTPACRGELNCGQ